MTIKIPNETFLDKILIVLGKRRGVIVPSEAYHKFGPYAYDQLRKESFWKALFRPKNCELPPGIIDIHTLPEQRPLSRDTKEKAD
jgi:hypothetical protein